MICEHHHNSAYGACMRCVVASVPSNIRPKSVDPTPDFVRPAMARTTDPETSSLAAAEMTDKRLTNLHQQIIEALRVLGVATRRMITGHTGEEDRTLSPRFRFLLDHDYIVVDHKAPCPVTGRTVEWLRLS